MAVKRGNDARGPYYRAEGGRTKYRYTPGSKRSRAGAKAKATQSARSVKGRRKR